MSKDEAIKRGMELLKSNISPQQWFALQPEITALREALAKPDFWEGYVPEPVKPAQQEPIKFKCTVIDDAHPDGIPLSQWGWQGSVTAAQKDDVFSASIEFIGTLTGMQPPPIEVAPPEILKPFRDFTEKVCSIFAAPQPAQQEPVAWKHDCAALLTNNVELWIDRCPHCGKPHTSQQPAQPAQQEPVAFLANGTRFKISYDSRQSGGQIHGIPPELGGRWVAFVAADDDCHLKLTSPPAQRTWQALTDEEIKQFASKHLDVGDGSYATHFVTGDVAFARAIEAKLKEKNT